MIEYIIRRHSAWGETTGSPRCLTTVIVLLKKVKRIKFLGVILWDLRRLTGTISFVRI